jgi:hypothetical protein
MRDARGKTNFIERQRAIISYNMKTFSPPNSYGLPVIWGKWMITRHVDLRIPDHFTINVMHYSEEISHLFDTAADERLCQISESVTLLLTATTTAVTYSLITIFMQYYRTGISASDYIITSRSII